MNHIITITYEIPGGEMKKFTQEVNLQTGKSIQVFVADVLKNGWNLVSPDKPSRMLPAHRIYFIDYEEKKR